MKLRQTNQMVIPKTQHSIEQYEAGHSDTWTWKNDGREVLKVFGFYK